MYVYFVLEVRKVGSGTKRFRFIMSQMHCFRSEIKDTCWGRTRQLQHFASERKQVLTVCTVYVRPATTNLTLDILNSAVFSPRVVENIHAEKSCCLKGSPRNTTWEWGNLLRGVDPKSDVMGQVMFCKQCKLCGDFDCIYYDVPKFDQSNVSHSNNIEIILFTSCVIQIKSHKFTY